MLLTLCAEKWRDWRLQNFTELHWSRRRENKLEISECHWYSSTKLKIQVRRAKLQRGYSGESPGICVCEGDAAGTRYPTSRSSPE